MSDEEKAPQETPKGDREAEPQKPEKQYLDPKAVSHIMSAWGVGVAQAKHESVTADLGYLYAP